MKKFETPEIEIVKFSVADVLTASSETTEATEFVPTENNTPII